MTSGRIGDAGRAGALEARNETGWEENPRWQRGLVAVTEVRVADPAIASPRTGSAG
ncbi:MAG TPA: hypothetical protein VHC18_21975 [Amycolatopsis sp.]|nr:hypothetical protein [Amycolatopsis sp.]